MVLIVANNYSFVYTIWEYTIAENVQLSTIGEEIMEHISIRSSHGTQSLVTFLFGSDWFIVLLVLSVTRSRWRGYTSISI